MRRNVLADETHWEPPPSKPRFDAEAFLVWDGGAAAQARVRRRREVFAMAGASDACDGGRNVYSAFLRVPPPRHAVPYPIADMKLWVQTVDAFFYP